MAQAKGPCLLRKPTVAEWELGTGLAVVTAQELTTVLFPLLPMSAPNRLSCFLVSLFFPDVPSISEACFPAR